MECTAGPDDAGRRFDRVCRKLLPDTGLSEIYSAMRKGRVTVNGVKKSPKYKLTAGDIIRLPENMGGKRVLPRNSGEGTADSETAPELGKAVMFENDHFIVFNKPAGILSHGKFSVQSYLRQYLHAKTENSLAFSPAPLHRLDRNTSGILVCSKSIRGAAAFSEALSGKSVLKAYAGIHDGFLTGNQLWKDKLRRDKKTKITYSDPSGRMSITHIFPLLRSPEQTLCLAVPITGRTHQIRVQAALHEHPLLGDRKYNRNSAGRSRYYLHACHLGFTEAGICPELPPLFAPPPEHFLKTMQRLFPAEQAHALVKRLEREIAGKIASISSAK